MKQLKRNGKRMLALFLAMVMCLSMVQLSAFAAGPQNQIGSYQAYDPANKTWSEAESDTVTNEAAGGAPAVKVSKTISAVEGTENLFNIDLKVETNQHIEVSEKSPAAAVVLVIDVSGSMKDNKDVDDGNGNKITRLEAAKNAAKSFVASFASGVVGETQRMVSIVAFGGSAWIKPLNDDGTFWIDVTSTDNLAKVNQAIDNLTCFRGTNIEAGLQLACNLYNQNNDYAQPVGEIDNRFSVLLTDGAPTWSIRNPDNIENRDSKTEFDEGNGDQYDSKPENKTNARDVAVKLLAVPNLQSYAICFKTSLQDWMKETDESNSKTETVYKKWKDGKWKDWDDGAEDWDEEIEEGYRKSSQILDVDGESRSCEVLTKWNHRFPEYLRYTTTTTTYAPKTFDMAVVAKDAPELNQTFETIMNRIKLAVDAWKVTDPIPAPVKFVQTTGKNHANGAVTGAETGTITWDLRKDLFSESTTITADGKEITTKEEYDKLNGSEATITYNLSYQVRLDTLDGNFRPEEFFRTNGVTKLEYYLTKNENGTEKFIDNKGVEIGENESPLLTMYFNVPQVKGFAGDLSFTKVDPEGTALNGTSGVVFTLASAETVKNADGKDVPAWSRTYTPNQDGVVNITGIPSGHSYTLTETSAPAGFDKVADTTVTVAYGEVSTDGPVEQNKEVVDPYTVTTRDVTITKKWEKPATEDTPESITVTLYQNGTAMPDYTNFVIKATDCEVDGDIWTYTFKDLLAKDAKGNEYAYTVQEAAMDGWTTTGNGSLNLVNTRTSNGTLTIQAQKTWVLPNNDQPKVTFKLIQNDKVIDSKELTGNGNVLFSSLPIYDGNGQLYTYDVIEEMGTGYSQSARTVEGVSNFRNYVFTNTVADEKIAEISGTKTWNDGDGTGRPGSITIKLLADGEEVASQVVTAENNWQYSFTNLPRYAFTKDDKDVVTSVREIKYTLEEVSVDGYKSDVTGYNVTNTRTGEVDLTVYKNWVDVTGTEHDDVTVKVSGNGKSWQETFKGHAIFEDLPKYDQFGNEIDYVVEELDVPEGYTSSVSYDWANNVVTVTNTRNDLDGRVNISVNKAWRQPGGEPDQTATFDLYADGEYMESRTITGNGSAIFDDLPRYTEDVEEPAIPAPVVPLPDDTVTPDDPAVSEDNTVTPDDPAAGEDNTVTPDDPAAGEDDTVTPDDPAAGGDDTVTPDDPAAGEDDTVTPDDPAAGEDSTVTPDDPAAGEDNTVTPGDSAEVEGSEAVPDMSILFAAPQVASLNEVADTYESPAVSAPANVYAREIEYTVKEVVPDGYTSTETRSSDDNGNVTYNFVNTITGITSVTVNKHWVKPENVAASEVMFKVYRGLGIENEEKTEVGTITISAGESTATLPNLPKYTEDGVRYLYTVEEASVPGYSSKTVGGIQADGSFVFDVTNTINPADITIPVTKVWVDGNKPNSERPEVTIWLLQGNKVPSGWGGSDYKSVTFKSDADGNVTAETATMVNGVLIPDEEAPIVTVNGNEWTCNVKVPQYSEDGTLKFEYQAREYDVPAGYAKTESGYTVTNKASGVTGIEISKMWTAPEGTAFPEITLTLSGSDGSSYTIIANSDGATMDGKDLEFASTGTTWTFIAAGLPKFDSDGAKIVYTLSEKEVEGYTQAEADAEHPYWIRNVINQEKIEVTAEKVWANMEASGYLNASYPANITVALFRGDEMVEGSRQVVANINNTFPIESYTDLDKYDLTTGQAYKYSVRELDAEDNAVAEGGVITFAADNSYRVSYVTEGNKTVITNTYQTSGEYFYQIRTHYVHYDAAGNVISSHEILRGDVVRLPEPQTVRVNSADYVVNSMDNLTYAFDSGNTSNVLTVDVQSKNELYTMELYYVLRDTAPTPEPPEETDPPETDPPEPDDPYYPPEPDDPYTPPTVEVPEVTIPDEEVPMAEVPEEVFPDVEVPQEEIPEVVIPDEDVPLAEIPEVIIPDEDVPLAEIPEVIIPDEDVPLAEVPEEPIPEIEIPEPDVPLANVPKTGENALWTILALTSGLGLVWLALDSKKRREEA